jgi:cysteine desulfurase
VEHSAVLHAADQAGDRTGVDVDRHGRVDVERFTTELRSDGVSLACLQSANGEVGTRQPVELVADAARSAGVPLLVDAAASLGHEPPPSGWDVLTGDPRAWGAPPGLGLLAVRAGVRWRSPYPPDEGTEPVPGAPSVPVALAAAVALRVMNVNLDAQNWGRRELASRVRTTAARVTDTMVAGDPDDRLPHVVTFSCLYVDGEALVDRFDRAGFAVGSGSACTASTLEPSHVLAAMGVLTHGNVRLGLPVGVTAEEIDRFCAVLPEVVADVRAFMGVEGL